MEAIVLLALSEMGIKVIGGTLVSIGIVGASTFFRYRAKGESFDSVVEVDHDTGEVHTTSEHSAKPAADFNYGEAPEGAANDSDELPEAGTIALAG